MNSDWQDFQIAFEKSIVAIDQRYVNVRRYVLNGHYEYVQRERVYCYELYHQLRRHLGETYPFTIHGEIDKRGQEFIRQSFASNRNSLPNPDFVIHVPGKPYRRSQLVAIEVKPSKRATFTTSQKDINKISTFVDGVGYQYGIFLVYGEKRKSTMEKMVNRLVYPAQNIYVIWHKEINRPPRILHNRQAWHQTLNNRD